MSGGAGAPFLACPFCGSADAAGYLDGDVTAPARVVCHGCGCSTGYFKTLKAAVAQWNTREGAAP